MKPPAATLASPHGADSRPWGGSRKSILIDPVSQVLQCLRVTVKEQCGLLDQLPGQLVGKYQANVTAFGKVYEPLGSQKNHDGLMANQPRQLDVELEERKRQIRFDVLRTDGNLP